MTKNAALQGFFSLFGLSAIPASSVPSTGDNLPVLPYLTYETPTDSEMNVATATASLWYRSESWLDINAKTEQISQYIGTGVVIPCDGGGMIIRKGTPFAQPMGDPSDDLMKRKVLSFEITFMTTT